MTIRHPRCRVRAAIALGCTVLAAGCGGRAREDVQDAVDDFTGKTTIEHGEQLKADLLKADSLLKSRRKELQDTE